ncbi:DNA-binding protein [Tabrizicola sp.]|uniref:DNA-binding protein n=1 Tax=Tabrizicola sp. TaxID=2005166 RepID=UPI0025D82FA5|nr:DNA-binding protein [Tabrizicola sp.]
MKQIPNYNSLLRPPAGKTERRLTMQDVATRDQCSVKSVRRAIELGLLEATRIGPSGRSIRITEAAYARYHALCATRA